MRLTIPYYLHKAGAGFPSPATDYIEEDIDLNVHLIKNVPATFIIRVQGKSMTDIGITGGGKGSNMLYLKGVQLEKLANDNIIKKIVSLVEKKSQELKNIS